MSYKLITKDGSAKRGEFTTPHGVIQTPVFMNVGTPSRVRYRRRICRRSERRWNCQTPIICM